MSAFRPSFPLLDAKLVPPALRPGMVERARLVRMLADASGPRIVSLVAPPGYGKTTTLAQWVAQEPRPVAWLTVDDFDNDPAILVTYLAAAFDRIRPLGASIEAGLSGPGERVGAVAVPRLVSELHRWPEPAVLVVDDVHRIVDRTCLDALSMFLDHLPSGIRVALAGRSQADLPFARFRVGRDLLEIDVGALAMREQEAEALTSAMGCRFRPDEIRALAARTEGWAAGIYLAALARTRGMGDGGSQVGVSGGEGYIAAYLGSEIGRGLDDDDVTFLTRTAVLETITPAVAEAVSGMSGADDRLQALARANLLIHGVGTSGSAWRYHNLLADYLLLELERREPGLAPELHRRASAWYGAAGNAERAIEHALTAGDPDAAARLVTGVALQTFYRGNVDTLQHWLAAFDTTLFERHPALAVIAGWVDLLTGRPNLADQMADIAERSSFEGPSPDGAASFASARAMLRAIMGRNGPRDVLENATLAASQEPPDSPWRTNARWLLGSAHRLMGESDTADAIFAEAVAGGASSAGTAVVALAHRASLAIRRGDWVAAEAQLEDGRARLVAAHYEGILPALVVYAVGARISSHRGDVDAAKRDLVRAQLVRPLASHAAPWFAVDALLELARAYLAVSDPAGAQLVLREAEQIVRRRPGLGVLTTELVEIRQRLAGAASTLAGSSTLTAAELRVLPFLPTYLSFQEIADRLVISRNTVKSHAMSIYGKLWASSRGEAVERAVELGLLEPYPALALSGPGRAQADGDPGRGR